MQPCVGTCLICGAWVLYCNSLHRLWCTLCSSGLMWGQQFPLWDLPGKVFVISYGQTWIITHRFLARSWTPQSVTMVISIRVWREYEWGEIYDHHSFQWPDFPLKQRSESGTFVGQFLLLQKWMMLRCISGQYTCMMPSLVLFVPINEADKQQQFLWGTPD